MPDHIKELYRVLLKKGLTAREYLARNRMPDLAIGKSSIIIYRGKVAAWISGYVL